MADSVFTLFVEVVLYGTARLVLPCITLGRVRVERTIRETTRIGWFGAGRDDEGRFVLSGEAGILAGFLCWLGIITIAVAILYK